MRIINPKQLRPPRLVVALLVSSTVFQIIFRPDRLATWPYGLVLFILGVAVSGLAAREFKRRSTPVPYRYQPTTVVSSGIFRLSRNPMYLGGVTAFLGIAFIAGSWPFFLSWIGLVTILNYVHIPWEEQRMEGLFGEDFRAYKRRTRRWI